MFLDFDFFYRNAGYSYDPQKETAEEGKQKCAWHLACAEFAAELLGYSFEWSIDPETDSSDFDDSDDPWQLWECVMTDEGGTILANLHAIDFGRDGHPSQNDYSRVVEAELALEVL